MTIQVRDPFSLASLPELTPPTNGWAAVSAQLQRQNRRSRNWFSGLAIAATVALVLGVVSILPKPHQQAPATESMLANESGIEASQTLLANSAESSEQKLGPENLLSLQKLSQRLEKNLAVLRGGVGAMPAEMVVYQVELEDLVAQVDAAISQQPGSSELWRQRVNLLMDLNQIYGAGLRRDEPYVASL